MTEVELMRAYGIDPEDWRVLSDRKRQDEILRQTLEARRDVEQLMSRLAHYFPAPVEQELVRDFFPADAKLLEDVEVEYAGGETGTLLVGTLIRSTPFR